MSVLTRDPVETTDALQRWLGEQRGLDAVVVDQVDIPAATGWSNETILFRARWTGADGPQEQELVARVAPREYTVFPDDTFQGQYQLMRALAEGTDVPAATVHGYEASPTWLGNPFWVMDRIRGEIATDNPPYAGAGWLHEASPEDQERAWWSGVDAVARVNAVDPVALGVDLSLLRPGDGSTEAQLAHLERYLTWAEDGRHFAEARRALDALRSAPPTPSGPLALSWGDARLSNLIYRDFEVVAVLDWEMACLGDPLLDLGWWVFADQALTTGSGCTRLPGFPSAEATVARWATRTGRDATSFAWYELYAALHFTVIMLRMGALLHDMGFVDEGFARSNLISDAMGEVLGRW